MRIPLTGGPIELVAWGLRNPFGLAFAPDGRLFVTENQFDSRGSRPIWGTGDLLWAIEPGTWYGWPDFFAGHPLNNKERFAPPGGDTPEPLLAKYPNDPPKPAAVFGVHASADGFDFSRSAAFGFEGEAFVAEFGDMAPGVGKTLDPVGFQVVRVNPTNGVIHSFATNKGDQNAPASYLKRGGLERPVDAKFSPDGSALYVVDFGVMTTGKKPDPRQNTGVLWRITRNTGGGPEARR
jgi:glucose/arabinose dehydrogenase